MSETIFREKSLDKVKSPDNLNEYIRVSNPGVWMLLVAIIVLLVGFCIWGVFGQLQTVVSADAHCEDGSVTCFISEKDSTLVRPGMPVTIAGHTGTVAEIEIRSGEKSSCTVDMAEPLDDGIYQATIQIESLHPASFLLN